MSTFSLNAAPGTDIWRKPPHTNIYQAPTRSPTDAHSASGSLNSFRSARISFAFLYKEQYDQAGLVLSFRRRSGDSSASPPPKWIKTGVEYYNGNPMLSTVACDSWADWSVTPLLRGAGGEADGKEWTTMTIVREGDGNGMSLWVYQLAKGPDGQEVKVPLREVCWVFGDEPEAWDLRVEAMAARPEKNASDDLSAEFRDFEVAWAH